MNNRARALAIYERLEKLFTKLPGPLQKPILAELEPIKKIFLLQRAPRLVLIGDVSADKTKIVNALFDAEILQPNDPPAASWQEISRTHRGRVRLLDARGSVTPAWIKSTLGENAPDVFLFLANEKTDADSPAHAQEILRFVEEWHNTPPIVIALLLKNGTGARDALHHAPLAKHPLADSLATTLTFDFENESGTRRAAQMVAEKLPDEARLEMARFASVQPVQKQIAQTLIKSVTAICAAVGAQPIPIADFPVLTSLQIFLVAGIAYIGGRGWNTKLAAEFLGAVGANVGAALVFRESARALVKCIPGWGNAISGGIAGAGTYSIGRAALAYFLKEEHAAPAERRK